VPSPRMGEPSKPVTLASLTENVEPPAGPTVMRLAHENGMRRVLGLLKNRFKEPGKADEAIRHAALVYLREWERTYKQGVTESPSTVDRTILDIRRDTVVQIMAELGRPPG
jgi:hypothetical protein